MISSEYTLIRNKITGVLLRTARLRAGRNADQCAAVLSCDPAFIVRAEEGQEGLTLPQLEGLAHFLKVPLRYLLGGQDLPVAPPLSMSAALQERMRLRRKIVGVMLRQARLESGRTLEDVATTIGCEPEHLDDIELGQVPVPLPELRALSQELGLSLQSFVSERGPSPQAKTSDARGTKPLPRLGPALDHLPPEIREFVLKPMNAPYLQAALNLSQMPAGALRQFASGLLEITY
jgi:transcriptional regulator with XRE-family HTH domain